MRWAAYVQEARKLEAERAAEEEAKDIKRLRKSLLFKVRCSN